MDRSLDGLAGAPEWTSLRSMLPDLQGRMILDLGCGFGWFCRWASEQGAQSVLGLDVSENMLKRAIEMISDDAVLYEQTDLEQINQNARISLAGGQTAPWNEGWIDADINLGVRGR